MKRWLSWSELNFTAAAAIIVWMFSITVDGCPDFKGIGIRGRREGKGHIKLKKPSYCKLEGIPLSMDRLHRLFITTVGTLWGPGGIWTAGFTKKLTFFWQNMLTTCPEGGAQYSFCKRGCTEYSVVNVSGFSYMGQFLSPPKAWKLEPSSTKALGNSNISPEMMSRSSLMSATKLLDIWYTPSSPKLFLW